MDIVAQLCIKEIHWTLWKGDFKKNRAIPN